VEPRDGCDEENVGGDIDVGRDDLIAMDDDDDDEGDGDDDTDDDGDVGVRQRWN
jgi:hypothetical protein